jgi:O-antigen/teichoic acid export membrane protein
MYFGGNAKILYAEKTKILWRVSFIAGLSNVLMNLVAIPIWGFESAIYTTFISYMYMGYSGFYFKVFKEINPVRYYPEFWLALTLIFTFLATRVVEMELNFKLLVSVSIVAGSLLLFLKIRKYFDEV